MSLGSCDDALLIYGAQKYSTVYVARTTDTQRELFFKNSKLLGLGRQIGPKFFEAFGVFSAKLLKVVQTKLIID